MARLSEKNSPEGNCYCVFASYILVQGILDPLTTDDVRVLVASEEELKISERFERIFPTDKTDKYLK